MFASIYNTFCNCFKIPELKSRIFFTLVVLAICRLEAVVHIPGLDGSTLQAYFASKAGTAGGSLLGMYSMFTGGALEHCAVGALGIMPPMRSRQDSPSRARRAIPHFYRSISVCVVPRMVPSSPILS